MSSLSPPPLKWRKPIKEEEHDNEDYEDRMIANTKYLTMRARSVTTRTLQNKPSLPTLSLGQEPEYSKTERKPQGPRPPVYSVFNRPNLPTEDPTQQAKDQELTAIIQRLTEGIKALSEYATLERKPLAIQALGALTFSPTIADLNRVSERAVVWAGEFWKLKVLQRSGMEELCRLFEEQEVGSERQAVFLKNAMKENEPQEKIANEIYRKMKVLRAEIEMLLGRERDGGVQ